jgi:hypothetical protein
MLTEKMIDEGIERNILIYDANAPDKFFTQRLFNLIQSVVLQNLTSPITRIYLHPDCLQDIHSWTMPAQWHVEYYQDGFFAGMHKRLFDKEFIPHTGLGYLYNHLNHEERRGNMLAYYDKKGGTLPSDTYLIVCESREGEIILASC